MRENCVKSIWQRGGAAVNGWIGNVAAEGMAQAGWDSECEAFVGPRRYAPTGYRSVGPMRARWLHGADYVKGANDTIPMREGNVTGAQSIGKSVGGSMY